MSGMKEKLHTGELYLPGKVIESLAFRAANTALVY